MTASKSTSLSVLPKTSVSRTAYEALDADIDKDNEQLSKLITEVKKRNQSQIQQHQLPNDNINNQPTVEYGYRITPLTAEKESSAIEGSNANR